MAGKTSGSSKCWRALTVKRGRLLLVLDDLQWCDADTLDWLHYLLMWPIPLLVVGTIRSDEEADDGHALQRLRHDLRARASSRKST